MGFGGQGIMFHTVFKDSVGYHQISCKHVQLQNPFLARGTHRPLGDLAACPGGVKRLVTAVRLHFSDFQSVSVALHLSTSHWDSHSANAFCLIFH